MLVRLGLGSVATSAVLMYHAVVRGNLSGVVDPHYAITANRFRAQLGLMAEVGLNGVSVRDLRRNASATASIALTFDDGAATDAEVAVPILIDCRATADFFVNTSTINTRWHVSTAQLRDMQAAGMSIQSHGHTHRLLDDLSEQEVRAELGDSRNRLEDLLGSRVTLFAPPGGRLPSYGCQLAIDLGYEAVCGSRPGLLKDVSSQYVPRLAVLAATTDGQYLRWIRQDATSINLLRFGYGMRKMAKSVLGNGAYVAIRGAALRMRRKSAAE